MCFKWNIDGKSASYFVIQLHFCSYLHASIYFCTRLKKALLYIVYFKWVVTMGPLHEVDAEEGVDAKYVVGVNTTNKLWTILGV